MNETFLMRTTSSITVQMFGDRSARTGCRCENVAFTGRIPQSGKLPLLKLLTGQKSGFSPDSGDSLHRFTSNLAGLTGTWGSAWLCKISAQSPQGVGMRPPKYQKFPLFGKESPRRGDSLDRFRKIFRPFLRLTILHWFFKFYVIHITGYGVIAEKPRIGQLRQIFPCTL